MMYRCILTGFSKKNSNGVERKLLEKLPTAALSHITAARLNCSLISQQVNTQRFPDPPFHWAGVHTCQWKSLLTLLFHSQQDGIISVQDIDLVMSEGLGMRYAFIGPMETMHLNAPKGNAPSPKTALTHVSNIQVCDVEAMN